jgi:DNA polymerase-3 subunit gamma/tau
MSYTALTAKYRPQTFAQVAGQETVKAILSRASLEQRVAPAYLLSGTRGVGKTTLARIFAKALNCRSAPTAEPCNSCDQCRAITVGSAVDVVEIDGASNRGIDDVRRLKEVVGYAPMEGGYKIFIIDEAHMLSREAFNALLKTLEEPPARVTFIMATTEPHKFPATIISRCQHFVFKALPESGLVAHLSQVLGTEGLAFDESGLHLIARRGAGSVRDAMSLLGQVLALGDGRLTESATRSVLGLAGQEVFFGLLQAVKNGDSLALSALLRDMLEQGLDLGFFLRELAALWRALFMLRQSGEQALAVIDLPENEARRYLELSRDFSLQHIHACWQMTLEGQRRVLTSLEPALALELLLLNIGMLPHLLSLENLSAMTRQTTQRAMQKTGGTPPSIPSVTPGGGPVASVAPATEVAPDSAAPAIPYPSPMQAAVKRREDLKAEVMEHPLVREVRENFGGNVIDYGQLR